MSALLALEDIRFAYPGRDPLFEGMSLSIDEGEHLGLFGHNGQGKTTLLRIMTGLETPSSGRILVEGREIRTGKDRQKHWQDARKKVGFVLQQAEDMLFSPTVLEDVAFGPLNLGLSKDEAREKSLAVLDSLGLSGFGDRPTPQLSGGEKKLVSLACVLVMEPKLVLFDEPTAGLDPDSVERLCEVVQALPQARITVSHDRRYLERVSGSYLAIKQGKVVRVPDCAGFFS